MQVYDNGTKIIVWYYETLLPLCDDNVIFTNNRLLAENRFTYFERKKSRNHQFINGYMKFMKKLISKGYATESKQHLKMKNAGIYLSMESIAEIGVERSASSFNVSAEYQGASINTSAWFLFG